MTLAGTVFTFRLANGLYGACRVIRAARAEEKNRGDALVCATQHIGDAAAALKSKETKKILRTDGGVALYWMKGAPPKSFAIAGVIATSEKDLAKKSFASAPWEIFPNIVYTFWRSVHEPGALERDRKAAREDGDKQLAAAIAKLQAKDGIDLAGFVPLPTPKKDREPEDVLRGFIAAMNQWEKECARIDKQNPGHLAVHMSGDAQRSIFEEFCTKKDRGEGRLGSYSTPPEYDPKTERVTSIKRNAKRVVIETERSGGIVKRVSYIFSKTDDGWLLDGCKHDGRASIL